MNRKEKKKLALAEIILILLAVIAVAVVIWIAWLSPSRSAKQNITSYDECVKAGNPVQLTYPGACTTPEGERFTDSSQIESSQNQKLAITQWGVMATISGSDDAYYVYEPSAKTVMISTKRLDSLLGSLQGCKSGLRGLTYIQVKPGDAKETDETWTEAELSAGGKKIGDYYYIEKPMVETACYSEPSETTVSIGAIQESIRVAMRNLQKD